MIVILGSSFLTVGELQASYPPTRNEGVTPAPREGFFVETLFRFDRARRVRGDVSRLRADKCEKVVLETGT